MNGTDYLKLMSSQEAYFLALTYGTSEPPSIPEEYEFIDYRVPKMGDYYLAANEPFDVQASTTYYSPTTCRIIVQKVPQPTTVHTPMLSYKQTGKNIYESNTVLIPAEYEYVDFRPAVEGEEYIAPGIFDVRTASLSFYSALHNPRIIVRKR